MKARLLVGTAIGGAISWTAGIASAAEGPVWSLSGNVNFQAYWVDQDAVGLNTRTTGVTIDEVIWELAFSPATATAKGPQEHDWYFGVDESELQIDVDGTADNGLNYGFKIEINANTTDGTVADEARLELWGGWGTLQLGDEDGAEDIMNYGGETIMGGTGGFDGDQDDYLFRNFNVLSTPAAGPVTVIRGAPGTPTIAGDTADATKVSYFSPRLSGFQFGSSLTPTPNDGDEFKADGQWENHYGLGANFDRAFGSFRIRASAVYSAASSNVTWIEDVAAWSVGGIVGWGPFSLAGNYTDNGDSGSLTFVANDTSYWNVAAGVETGPLYFSAGYFKGTNDWGVRAGLFGEGTYQHIALSVDYSVAPGLGTYAEFNKIEDDGTPLLGSSNDTNSVVVGANISF